MVPCAPSLMPVTAYLMCPGLQEYVKLHQRYLVKGEEVLNEWHMEKMARRTGSISMLHGPYLKPPVREVMLWPAGERLPA